GPLCALRPAIELPGSDDDLPLRIDQFVDRACVAGARHGLALRQRELLLVWLDIQEKDVAACLVGPLAAREVARADVVGDEITRLHVEIFESEQVPGGCRRGVP